MLTMASLSTIAPGQDPDVIAWEAAYSRFETPEQEIQKFIRRLIAMGASSWKRECEIAELFCGRGNGLVALAKLGFSRIEGVDLSPALLSQYTGPARCHAADCRALPFDDGSKDRIIIQGGLHHLQTLPGDLDRCLSEMHRVLKANGEVLIVEPWLTPFLSFVHWVCGRKMARRLFSKIDSLATMIEHEQKTYYQWLRQPGSVLNTFDRYFVPAHSVSRWGKLMFTGRKRNGRV
jgi:ubiquinone/menaquinone biosynthesis C-methylase UbiE